MNDSSTPPRQASRKGGTLKPFAYPIFRNIWMASLISNFGGLVQSVGASWMMASITPSAYMVALVQSSTTLPIMLLSLAAGALADNMDRRRVMLSAQSFMMVVSVLLASFAWMGWITPWLLLVFTFLIGCGVAFNSPAWQASVGDMVPREDLPHAIALNSMGFNIARSAGPAIGGAIVAIGSAAAAFTVNAFSYLGMIFVISRWRPKLPPQTLPRERLGDAMAAGIRYAAMSPLIRTVILRSAVFGIATSGVMAMMPLVARDLIRGGPLVYGLMSGAFGVGAVSGALSNAHVRKYLSSEWIVRWTSLCFAGAAVLTGFSTSLFLTVIALLVAGASWVLALSIFNVTVQMSAPRWVVARSLALYQMAAFGGMAAGSWLWGALADGYRVEIALYASGALSAFGALLGFLFPIADTQAQNLDLSQRWREPDTVLDIEPRSGPVAISIEYVIDPSDVLAFLSLMAERRRIRRRDGARNWTLLRDLGDPQIWVERYETPTWLDYVRHNQRLTHADAEIADRILALHKGPQLPRVHRMIERQTGSLPNGRGASAMEITEPLTDPSGSS